MNKLRFPTFDLGLKKLRSYISLLLLTVISVLLSPKELLHAALPHHDTEDVTCNDVCKEHFSAHHQHCDVLQLTTPPLYLAVTNFSFSFEKIACLQTVESTSKYQSHSSAYLFLRGPPAV